MPRLPPTRGRSSAGKRNCGSLAGSWQPRAVVPWSSPEPGIGRTSLLGAAQGQAEEAGFTVVRVAGSEPGAEVPFHGLHRLRSAPGTRTAGRCCW
uniref:TxnRg1 n=1 Tax=Streptomyces bottropensis TaxID=42235 RepID=A0A0K1H3D1_9ACTN|nr:TxnRg1 [Streptomyces bottropensis]